ncbi:MAG TPA: sensor histidine kinase [Kofleriaceae bacterium]|nr:sensor histidine kinase [Kofleriaceae bacterium]
MRFRIYALLVLVVVGLVPLAAFGILAVQRAGSTAVAEVRGGNERLAYAIARRIDAHIEAERDLLHTIGIAILQADVPDLTQNAFSIQFPNFHDLTVYAPDGRRVAGPPVPDNSADHRLVAAQARAGKSAAAPVRPPAEGRSGPFAHTITVGEPLVLAGEPAGAVVAQIDLMEVWKPINQVRVGKSGFVRLVTADGTLLAHGDPEERRYVFSSEGNRKIVASARAGRTITNQQGVESFAAVADVGERGWMIVVEQPVAQALGAVTAMKRSLFLLVCVTLVIAVLAAYFAGRKAVHGIERLGLHTRVLASGKLGERVDIRSGLAELDALGAGINEMAASLEALHDDARRRERLTTFGRVAAGLTHDLRHPIESVRTACESLAAHREDEDAWELFEFMRQKELPKLKRYLEDLRRLTAAGSVSLSLHHIEPVHLLEDIAADLRASPKWRGVSFAVESKAEAIDADENLLRRAVYNLAANAADACVVNGRGGEVILEAAEGTGTEVTIRVRDNGPGMSTETLERVMSGEFHSTKRSNGIGLGLGVARHVAQLHGGRMEATSQLGAGTTFTLALPRAGEEGQAGVPPMG